MDEVLGPEDEVFIVFRGSIHLRIFLNGRRKAPDRLLDVFESFAANGRTLVVLAYYLGFAGRDYSTQTYADGHRHAAGAVQRRSSIVLISR